MVEHKPDGDANKRETLKRGLDLLDEAVKLPGGDESCDVHKWKAIMISAYSGTLGTKEKIERSFDIKTEATRAVELNPDDSTPHFVLGTWCWEVSQIGWLTRKLAATLFATPPEATVDEAIGHLKKAVEIEPSFKRAWATLAKCYESKGDKTKAKEAGQKALACKTLTDNDKQIDKDCAKYK